MGAPRIVVGMPVYDGEDFLTEAVEGVLAQDFDDLQLVIADNASTDGTLALAQRFAATDPRVRVLTSDVNRGLAWNFNRVFLETDSELFMWNAADDVRAPRMVSQCVAALDADPRAVLAYPGVVYIDESSRPVRRWPRTGRASAATPSRRFADVLLHEEECFPAHGVIRRSALERTRLHGGYPSSDRVLLAELALLGRFAEVDEELLLRRDHPGRSMRRFATTRDRNAFFDPRRAEAITFPRWRLGAEFGRALARAELTPQERIRAAAALARWTGASWRPLARNVGTAARLAARRARTARAVVA